MTSFTRKTILSLIIAFALCATARAGQPVEYYLIPHFHWDLAYKNTESGYKAIGNMLITQYAAKCEKDPDYKLILDQVPLMKAYTDRTPGGAKKLRKLAAEGRLEITGAMYVQPDLNLPDGENLIRNALYGIRWAEKNIGVRPRYLWNVDSFGQLYQMPQLAKGFGLDANVWSYDRTDIHKPATLAFTWVSPDGSSIRNQMLYPTYMGGNRLGWSYPYDRNHEWALMEDMIKTLNAKEKSQRYIIMCGGDFSPPPQSLADLARDWNANHTDSKLIVAAAADFFKADTAAMKSAPKIINTEFQVGWNGFLSNVIEDKLLNRAAENLLRQGEALHTWAKAYGAEYPHEDFERNWIYIIENTFHDEGAGSVYDPGREDLVKRQAAAMPAIRKLVSDGTAFFASGIDTAAGAPAGAQSALVLFNTLSFKRDAVAELDNTFSGDFRIADAAGNEITYQLVDGKIVFIAALPSMGWKTYYILPGKSAAFSPVEKEEPVAAGGTVTLRGPRGSFSVTLDEKADITSLTAGAARKELVAHGSLLNELCMQPDEGTDYDYAPHASKEFLEMRGRTCTGTGFEFKAVVRKGPVLTRLVSSGKTGASDVTRDVRVYSSLNRIDNIVSVDWKDEQHDLYTVFRYAGAGARTDSIPLGYIRRTADGRFPIVGWGDWGGKDLGATILTRGLSDVFKRDSTIYMTLLRSVSTLDHRLPSLAALSKGKHELRYSIVPRSGGVFSGRDPFVMSQDFNDVVPAEINEVHSGRFPAEMSFIETPQSSAATALFVDGGKTVLRILETKGSSADASVRISLPGVTKAESTNLIFENGTPAAMSRNALKIKLSPQKIQTFVLE